MNMLEIEARNRDRRSHIPYDIRDDEVVFDKIKRAFKNKPPVVNRVADVIPIFVLGMPRSGTTLVEQILASHPEVHTVGELTLLWDCISGMDGDFGLSELEELRRSYLKALPTAGKKYVIDKMPLNFRWIGFILSAMPEAKIVYLNRDARATCFSNYTANFAYGHEYSFDQESIAHYYNLHKDLMQFWKSHFSIYEVGYEFFTEHQESETRKLLEYIGLPWDARCLNFHNNGLTVTNASANEVKQPMFRGSSEKWKEFSWHLAPMLKILDSTQA